MSPIEGFTNNPLRTRSDLIRAATALIQPLHCYKSAGKARIKISTATGTHFSEIAAQLEGFARPLWVVPDLLHLSSAEPSHLRDTKLQTWLRGLKAGTDPKSPEYWGDLSDIDQRMVEMESIAFALLLYPDTFGFADDQIARDNLASWLKQINKHKMPQNNWLWFRVLVNLALTKSLGVPLSEVKNHMDEALEVLDTFYLSDGWSSDGFWGEERQQADYYSGSFAIQFAQLLFMRFAPDYEPQRTAKYKDQACQFAKEYWRYFAPNGAAIPFGRSLTYRFACAAFWAAIAVSSVDLPAPVDRLGTIKGLLLRHIRWWSKQPNILNADGTLNIGYIYPNMHLAENYNSPQSIYWCLKSLIVIGLDETHPFWTCEELPHPQLVAHSARASTKLLWPPRHIVCNTSSHHFLLSSGQSTSNHFKGREAKYGKFAYSSRFGFSVPCGSFIEQIAPDSTLAVSLSGEEDSWKVRWDPQDVVAGTVSLGGEEVPTLTSTWKPWKKEDLRITTMLIAPSSAWPGWHVRVHRFQWKPLRTGESETLRLVEGGFATSAQTRNGDAIFESECKEFQALEADRSDAEGWWSEANKALVLSESGASGIIDLPVQSSLHESVCKIIRADPNTNIVYPRSLIPTVQYAVRGSVNEWFSATGVFTVEESDPPSKMEVLDLWANTPRGHVTLMDNGEQFIVQFGQ